MLDAQQGGRVFLITATAAVAIENLIVTGGLITGLNLCEGDNPSCGGGIFATGPLPLNNVNVIGNQSIRLERIQRWRWPVCRGAGYHQQL